MTSKRRNENIFWRIGVLGLLSIALLIPCATSEVDASPLGRCSTVDTPWPVVLPDGSVHEGRQLRICLSHLLNPVVGLHEITIGKNAIGRYMSRIGQSEAPAGRDPVLVFYRNGANEHRLVGYAWPDGEFMNTYRLFDLGRPSREALRIARTPLLKQPDAEDDIILIAARRE